MNNEVTLTLTVEQAYDLCQSLSLAVAVTNDAALRALLDLTEQAIETANPIELGDCVPGEDMDGDFDSGMASAGLGTDEDYGGGDERY